MAQNDLSEHFTGGNRVIRQALRVVAKRSTVKKRPKGNDVGNILFNVWNTFTEQPDTRSGNLYLRDQRQHVCSK